MKAGRRPANLNDTCGDMSPVKSSRSSINTAPRACRALSAAHLEQPAGIISVQHAGCEAVIARLATDLRHPAARGGTNRSAKNTSIPRASRAPLLPGSTANLRPLLAAAQRGPPAVHLDGCNVEYARRQLQIIAQVQHPPLQRRLPAPAVAAHSAAPRATVTADVTIRDLKRYSRLPP